MSDCLKTLSICLASGLTLNYKILWVKKDASDTLAGKTLSCKFANIDAPSVTVFNLNSNDPTTEDAYIEITDEAEREFFLNIVDSVTVEGIYVGDLVIIDDATSVKSPLFRIKLEIQKGTENNA